MSVDPLPVRVRVCHGEDVTSYAARLAAANGFTVHEVEKVLRVQAMLTSTSPRHPLRLQAWRALGQLHPSAFTAPVEVDQTWVSSRPLCLACTRGEHAVGRRPDIGWVCREHGRWLGAEQRDVSDRPDVLRAEQHFRKQLVPRRVLFDSPAMLLAWQLGLLSTPPTPGHQPQRRGEPDPNSYPGQVAWATVLTNPAFLADLVQSTPATVRLDAIDRVTPQLEPDVVWRVKSRLLRLAEGLRRLPPASESSAARGVDTFSATSLGVADVFLRLL